MRRRALGLVGVLLVALLLPGASRPADATPSPSHSRAACHGVTQDEVVGARPTYTAKRLGAYRNDRHACHALWLPRPRRNLVPQGIALDPTARTAWVSGFRYEKGYGNRPCRLVQVDLPTGRLRAFRAELVGAVRGRPDTFCRHGGGIARQGGLLWVAEKNRLWLVDPATARGDRVRALRVWRLEAPVRGSAVVLSGTRIGLVPFQKTGRPVLFWYELADVRRRGVVELARRDDGRRRLGAVARTRVPTLVQGATVGPDGGVYLTRSNLSCGELVLPGGRRVEVVPGAEGLAFGPRGRRLWVVSESGSRPYARSRGPLTAAVTAYDWPALAHGRAAACGFR